MLKACFILTLTFLIQSTMANENAGPTKALMHTFLIEISKLRPYLNSENAFASEQGKKQVDATLNTLNKKLKKPSNEIDHNSGFRLTYSMMQDHIEKTAQAFQRGEYEYARLRLNGTTNFCISCHTQTPRLSTTTPFDFLSEVPNDVDFNNASFLFVTRRYGQALAQFDQLIKGYPKNNLTIDQLNDIVRKKLTVFARIQRDPGAAIANLNQDLKNKDLPKSLAENIKSWIKELKKWKTESVDPSQLKTPELILFVESNLPKDLPRKIAPTNVDSLKLLRLSGLLYERLFSEEHVGTQAQPLLYYLAIAERSLSPLYWYSVSEVYLKECVVRYPKQEYAKKCFVAYRQGLEERYPGGHLPESVQQSLNALKDYL